MRKEKRCLAVVIVLLLLMSLFTACGGQDSDAEETAKTAATVESTIAEEESEAEETKESKATEAVKETTKTSTATKSTTKNSKTETKTSTKNSTSATKETTKQNTSVCYITVEGYCSSKEVAVKNGMTVYDVLKSSGANVSARSTGYGVYVEGINGRFEFDEGPDSGWVYTVNGNRINESCDAHKVSSGDKIVWSYVN